MSSSAKVQAVTIVASVALHAGLSAGLLHGRPVRMAFPPTASEVSVATPPAQDAPADELSASESATVDAPVLDPTGDPPRAAGGEVLSHLDTGAPGGGGDACGSARALNLADRDEGVRLSPDLTSRVDRDQLQRLRAGLRRASWEDRRSTTHPSERTIVATGTGTVGARRPAAASMPSRGVLRSPAANVTGTAAGIGAPADVEGDRHAGSASPGAAQGAPGLGLADARAGFDHRASAPIALSRPAVSQGPVAVPANERARPVDDVDSEQEVATTERSLTHASPFGGALGEGIGGSGGGQEAGLGAARGAGAVAQPLGVGESDVYDYWTSDPRLLPYFRRLHARIDPLWADAFPRSALLELKQGTVILEMTVFADGRVAVTWPPLRPSGIDEFDRNCADAIRRAAPLPPIPPELGVRTLRIRAPFVANNPIIK